MSKWMRRALKALGALVVLIAVLAGAAFAVSERNLRRSYVLPARPVAVPSGPAAVERGQHFARAITKCVDCHGDDLGGKVYVDDPAIGRFVPVNLTKGKGGVGAQLTPADWERAVRHGVGRDGKPLLFMPSEDYATLSDEDLGAIIAWAQQLPPVDRELPPTKVGPMARVLNAAGQLPLAAQTIAHTSSTQHAASSPPPGPTAEYGSYLANVGGCTGCHGPGLSGGHVPGTPPDFKPAANLTPTGIGHYTEADFFRALREGVRPNGTKIDPFMPWKLAREMSDDEIRAVHAYLRTVPPKEYGSR